MNANKYSHKLKQQGVAAVEFALVSIIFFVILIGVMEVSRVLFYLNTASEVTRLGARLAVVCDLNSPAIRRGMVNMLGILTNEDITISYNPSSPSACTADTCESVTVSVAKNIDTFVPFIPFSVSMPAFSTTLPRESMSSADNPVCSTTP